jgi:glutamate-1-semialdehyde aminotransferase
MANIINRKLDKSFNYWDRASKTILSGTQLYSKGPETHVKGVSPIYLEKGKNAHVWDVDGNEYIDYDMGLGPVLLGYCYEPVDYAVIEQLKLGMGFSLVSPKEVDYAELLVENIPSAEKVRFLKTGSSAAEAAVRIARAYTGRYHIIRGEYHGWHEWTTAGESVRQGGIIPNLKEYVHKFKYNDFEELERLFKQYHGKIAAVIIEPVEFHEPENNFLKNVLELCHKNNALLIFDEVVTGFRFAVGGAQEYFGITPDLTIFGKAIANGMPLSAVVGKNEIMESVDKKVFISTTFGGETLSLAAAIAVINELKNKDVIGRLWSLGAKLKKETNDMAQRMGLGIELQGYAPRMIFDYRTKEGKQDFKLNTLFMQECVKRGVLLGWCVVPCYTHTENDIDFTLNVFEDAMKIYKKAIDSGNFESYLEGEPLKIVLG